MDVTGADGIVIIPPFAIVGFVLARRVPRNPIGWSLLVPAVAAMLLRVQRLVDRRFNRARYDTEAIVTAFTLRLRDAVDLDTIRDELLQAVDRAVEPVHASVWLRQPKR